MLALMLSQALYLEQLFLPFIFFFLKILVDYCTFKVDKGKNVRFIPCSGSFFREAPVFIKMWRHHRHHINYDGFLLNTSFLLPIFFKVNLVLMKDVGYDNSRKQTSLFLCRIGTEELWQCRYLRITPSVFCSCNLEGSPLGRRRCLVSLLFLSLASLLKVQIKMSIDAIQSCRLYDLPNRYWETISLSP